MLDLLCSYLVSLGLRCVRDKTDRNWELILHFVPWCTASKSCRRAGWVEIDVLCLVL